MQVTRDRISNTVIGVINSVNEPLETKELQELVEKKIGKVTRTKLFYRLLNLRGEQKLKGKFVGPGKGVWIWWKYG